MTRCASLAAAALLLLAACAPKPAGTPGRQANIISEAEIRAIDVQTAYDLVQRLRPDFLRTRGTSSMRSPVRIIVYRNNVHLGNLEALTQIMAREVLEIRYINARDATTRFGTGHNGGVIEVITRTR